MQCMRYVKRIKFFEKNAHTQFFFFEFHILNTKLGRRKSSDYKSTMARLLSQTLYSSPAVIRNAWHYISQFNQIEIVGNKEDKGRAMNFSMTALQFLTGKCSFFIVLFCEVFLQLRILGQVRLGKVRLGQVKLGWVGLGQVGLGQVRFGFSFF